MVTEGKGVGSRELPVLTGEETEELKASCISTPESPSQDNPTLLLFDGGGFR